MSPIPLCGSSWQQYFTSKALGFSIHIQILFSPSYSIYSELGATSLFAACTTTVECHEDTHISHLQRILKIIYIWELLSWYMSENSYWAKVTLLQEATPLKILSYSYIEYIWSRCQIQYKNWIMWSTSWRCANCRFGCRESKSIPLLGSFQISHNGPWSIREDDGATTQKGL